jgi:hypothetical protein
MGAQQTRFRQVGAVIRCRAEDQVDQIAFQKAALFAERCDFRPADIVELKPDIVLLCGFEELVQKNECPSPLKLGHYF